MSVGFVSVDTELLEQNLLLSFLSRQGAARLGQVGHAALGWPFWETPHLCYSEGCHGI